MANSTVVVSVYNDQEYLKKTLMSLEQQVDNDFEVIIIDDGSIDDSSSIIKEYINNTCRKVRVIYNKENTGISEVRNLGIELTDTPYITFLDGDDFLDKFFIYKMNGIVNRHNPNTFDLIRGNVNLIDKCGNSLFDNRMTNYREEEIIYPIIDRSYTSNEIISCNGRYYQTDFIKNLKFYDSSIEDYEFFLDIIANNPKIIYTDYAVYNYVSNPNGRNSMTIKNPYQTIVDCFEIAQRVRDRNISKNILTQLRIIIETRELETVLRDLKLDISDEFKKCAAWYITDFFEGIINYDTRFIYEHKLLKNMMGGIPISSAKAMKKMKKIASKH